MLFPRGTSFAAATAVGGRAVFGRVVAPALCKRSGEGHMSRSLRTNKRSQPNAASLTRSRNALMRRIPAELAAARG